MTHQCIHRAAILAAICLGTAAALVAAGSGDRATSQDLSIQAIRGIKGIDTITLSNLEAVLRIQTREPPPPPGHAQPVFPGTSDSTEMGDPQPDARQDMTINLEGS